MHALIASAILLVVIFLITWWICVRVDNYSFVDAAWSLAFAPVAIIYAVSLDGWWLRRLAVAVLIISWSLRLGIYLLGRIRSHHPKEDKRYAVLRENWSGKLTAAFLKFFLAQGLLVWLLMLPVYFICQRSVIGFTILELIGVCLWAFALIGEAIADAQLKRFKKNNTEPDAVCQHGLWHYSRHPNYFFQSLLWWGLFLIALPAPFGWLAILAPLAMLFFLLRVTGIPLTEKLAVESKGDAYRKYQQTTSALVPWFRANTNNQ